MLGVFHKDFVHKRWRQPILYLNNSVASNWIFLLCIVVELPFPRSSVNENA